MSDFVRTILQKGCANFVNFVIRIWSSSVVSVIFLLEYCKLDKL